MCSLVPLVARCTLLDPVTDCVVDRVTSSELGVAWQPVRGAVAYRVVSEEGGHGDGDGVVATASDGSSRAVVCGVK